MADPSRRTFLGAAGGAALGLLVAELALDAAYAAEQRVLVAPENTAGGILELELRAESLDALEPFYCEVIGWKARREGSRLTVQAGGTRVHFRATAAPLAPYHVAWTIPSNRFAEAKRWLGARTPLLRAPDGRDEFHFVRARRRGIYFADPAGNVLELIARDAVGDRSHRDFDLDQIRRVNHVGLAVRQLDSAVAAIGKQLGLQPVGEPVANFTKLGDANRHLVLVSEGRLWIPERLHRAAVQPCELVLQGPESRELTLDGYPYRIATAPQV